MIPNDYLAILLVFAIALNAMYIASVLYDRWKDQRAERRYQQEIQRFTELKLVREREARERTMDAFRRKLTGDSRDDYTAEKEGA